MSFVQFRIHPSIGLARYGDSLDLYYVASDFPQFMQEYFPKTRNLPRSRTHPDKLAAAWVSGKKTGNLATYDIFDSSLGADENYKDNNKKIKPQAARFRVFAYVYSRLGATEPRLVFEVDADTADITWTVELANRKSNEAGADIDTVTPATVVEAKQSGAATLEAIRLKVGSRPTLAYLMLERNAADKAKLTGRLHLIGNEGECAGTKETTSLWSDDWFDSGCDGPVRATIKLKDFAAFRSKVTRGIGTLKYLDPASAAPVAAAAATEVNAVPAWAVVGPPDYSPDMSHFVSLWDLALDCAMECARNGKVVRQDKIHRQISTKGDADLYRLVDYWVHIHPQLCLFSDVNFTSGTAKGVVPGEPGHNNDKPVVSTDTPRGLALNVRDGLQLVEMVDVKAQKDPSAATLNGKKKIALYERIPTTLYTYFDNPRHFIENLDGAGDQQTKTKFPRNLGRRVGYDVAEVTRHSPVYDFPSYEDPVKQLRPFHSNTDAAVSLKDKAGRACGKTANLKNTKGDSAIDGMSIKLIDDMFWPASMKDMPLLRELAYTSYQNEQFKIWQAPADAEGAKMSQLFTTMVSASLKTDLETGVDDRDLKFDAFVKAAPKYAPAMMDMANAGSMLGGSFLPGIEVGREAGVATNWTMMHGGTDVFPDIRFKPTEIADEHLSGRLTKDLAIPWQKDFIACDEAFWPTSRPGMVQELQGAVETTVEWQISRTDYTMPVGSTALEQDVLYFNRYWKDLGFVRREAPQKFVNREMKRP